ncbi:MAG: ruvC [Phenylobacterium sp.]|nr:ruvC [Phenylobacterium sp.]
MTPQRLLNPADVLHPSLKQMTNAPILMRAPLRFLHSIQAFAKLAGGVISVEGSRLTDVAHGVIAPKDSPPFAERLLVLFEAQTTVRLAPNQAPPLTGSTAGRAGGRRARRSPA